MATRRKKSESLTTEILIQIRDEMRSMRSDIQLTNERIERLEMRQRDDSLRLATELVAVAHAVGQVRDLSA